MIYDFKHFEFYASQTAWIGLARLFRSRSEQTRFDDVESRSRYDQSYSYNGDDLLSFIRPVLSVVKLA